MCKVKSSESNVTTMNELLEGLKSELFTEARETKLQEIVETVFNEHMNHVRERIKTALTAPSVCEDNGAPVAHSLKFYPSYDYHSMVCDVKDTKSSSNVGENISLSETSLSYFSNELTDLLCYRRFCKQMAQRFVSAGFDNRQMFIVDISGMMQEYING